MVKISRANDKYINGAARRNTTVLDLDLDNAQSKGHLESFSVSEVMEDT